MITLSNKYSNKVKITREILDDNSNVNVEMMITEAEAECSAICGKCGNFMIPFKIYPKPPWDKKAYSLDCWMCEICNFE